MLAPTRSCAHPRHCPPELRPDCQRLTRTIHVDATTSAQTTIITQGVDVCVHASAHLCLAAIALRKLAQTVHIRCRGRVWSRFGGPCSPQHSLVFLGPLGGKSRPEARTAAPDFGPIALHLRKVPCGVDPQTLPRGEPRRRKCEGTGPEHTPHLHDGLPGFTMRPVPPAAAVPLQYSNSPPPQPRREAFGRLACRLLQWPTDLLTSTVVAKCASHLAQLADSAPLPETMHF